MQRIQELSSELLKAIDVPLQRSYSEDTRLLCHIYM